MTRTATLFLALALACGGGDTDNETDTAETTSGDESAETSDPATSDPIEPGAAGEVWVLMPFTLTDSGGQSVSMDATGLVTVPDADREATIQLHPDGRVEVDGNVVLTMAPDGTLADDGGEAIAQIAEDGTTTVAGRTVSFGPDGMLQGGNPDGPSMTLTPADTPAKRAAMTVLLMLTL